MNLETVNWDAVSAIGTLIGATATFAAVVVALFQTKVANIKRLKLAFSDSHIVIDTKSGKQESGPYFYISAANTGNRDITIENWFIEVGKGSSYLVKNNESLPFLTQLPTKIAPEESIDLAVLRKDILDALRKNKSIGFLDMKRKITIVLRDNTSKTYRIKSRKSISKYLKMGDDD